MSFLGVWNDTKSINSVPRLAPPRLQLWKHVQRPLPSLTAFNLLYPHICRLHAITHISHGCSSRLNAVAGVPGCEHRVSSYWSGNCHVAYHCLLPGTTFLLALSDPNSLGSRWCIGRYFWRHISGLICPCYLSVFPWIKRNSKFICIDRCNNKSLCIRFCEIWWCRSPSRSTGPGDTKQRTTIFHLAVDCVDLLLFHGCLP